MRLIPIAEIPQLEPDEPIISLAGTITKLYDRKTGTNSNGAWSIQNGELRGDDGHVIGLFITGKEDMGPFKGKKVLITAHKGEKGWSGVYAFDDKAKDKVTIIRKVKITGTGEIAIYEEEGAPAKPQQQAAQQPTQRQSAPAQQPAMQPKNPPANAIVAAKRWAMQIANLQILCHRAVYGYVADQIGADAHNAHDTEHMDNLAMNMIIQGMRDGIHNTLPTVPMEPQKKEAAPAKPVEPPTPPPQPKPEPPPRPFTPETDLADDDIPF